MLLYSFILQGIITLALLIHSTGHYHTGFNHSYYRALSHWLYLFILQGIITLALLIHSTGHYHIGFTCLIVCLFICFNHFHLKLSFLPLSLNIQTAKSE